MKRGFVVAVGGAAIVVAGLAGCGGQKKSTTGSTTTAPTASASGTATAGTAPAKVTIDGQDQNVHGSLLCNTVGGAVNIAIGEATTGIAAVLSDADPPQVRSVVLGNVNGVALGYQSGVNQGNAEATKDGKSYKITGTATGVNMSNPLQPVNKPFEIDVTCP
ncbi:lipoprotein LpqH [Mycobacterium sp.]|uniref:lipoprotein LpqH n=1 Tax=Mycobacterium sp. TaxID=1785 RepID=UPI002D71074C|nr:lipoprotein LpqH [Mycobacterium sp.]HZA11183.1 lipoprotein LpqH [Mycobacterium sp.]